MGFEKKKTLGNFRGVQKKTRGIFMGLGFWPLKSKKRLSQFFRISRGETLFSPEFLKLK